MWDYSEVANAYLKRPDYSDKAIDEMLNVASITSGNVCDIGAGTAHLTMKLAERQLQVIAIEPNDNMRVHGINRTKSFKNVSWVKATAESTQQLDNAFDLVTFGSSFNVVEKELALKEVYRILKSGGWLACMYNYRDLRDTLQERIENIVKDNVPSYDYGTRRTDHAILMTTGGLFDYPRKIEEPIFHVQSRFDCVEAWRSHVTLKRQAGTNFDIIIDKIAEVLPETEITIPYITTIWVSKIRK